MASLLTTVLPLSVGASVLAVGGWFLYRTLRCDQTTIPTKCSPEQQSLLTTAGPGRASYSALGASGQRHAWMDSGVYTSSGVPSDATGAEPCSLGLQPGDRVACQLYVADELTSSPEAISESFLQKLQHQARNSADNNYLSVPIEVGGLTATSSTVPATRASPVASGATGLSKADLPLADSNAPVVVLVADDDRYSPSCSPRPGSISCSTISNICSSPSSCNVTTANTLNKNLTPTAANVDAPVLAPTHRSTEAEASPNRSTSSTPSLSRCDQSSNGNLVANASTTSVSPQKAVPLEDQTSHPAVDVTTTPGQCLSDTVETYPEKPPPDTTEPSSPMDLQDKVRCQRWPNCNNRNCNYHHPSQKCPAYPQCSAGESCYYIHPKEKKQSKPKHGKRKHGKKGKGRKQRH
ncbi:hypothetical protein IWQ62_001158 [Dispira parvispora]|uniref:C3H1-type domain-containing protein n=1 Tax=Dispira parvispora TaxID=1520584 RepID=A0A9W8E9E5_9FUNG|nr:hypothetical protein IWQ62_001158 [Dispira parvispora]